MTERRPKDMADAELAALPVGPIVTIDEPITAEDIANGVRGRVKVRYEMRKTRANWCRGDDIMAWSDGRESWSFGQFEDGSWYKEPFII